jgi:hypothetical protein
MLDMLSNHVKWNHRVSSINVNKLMSALRSNQPLFPEGRSVDRAVGCLLLTAETRIRYQSIQNL